MNSNINNAKTIPPVRTFRAAAMVSVLEPPQHDTGLPIAVRLKFKSQRKLPDTVASGVSLTRGKDLSECAFTQIVARIIEVYVVGEIGKAAFELQLKPLRELEILGEPQRKVDGPGANQRPHASVAKAANDAGAAIRR